MGFDNLDADAVNQWPSPFQAEAAGFVTKGEKIWYQAGSRLRPYGYPFAYIPNITHQYIVIFQKPKPIRRAAPARRRPGPHAER